MLFTHWGLILFINIVNSIYEKKRLGLLKRVLKLPKFVTRSEAPTWLPPLQILGVSYVLVQGGDGGGW